MAFFCEAFSHVGRAWNLCQPNQTELCLQGDSVTLLESVKLEALENYPAYLQTGSV